MGKVSDQEEARTHLLEDYGIKPGDKLYTILRRVSASGMSRVIDIVQPMAQKDGTVKMYHLGWNAAQVLGAKYDSERQGVRVSGCGMDMGFHLVYSLSCALFPDGFGVEGTGPLGHKIRPKTRAMAAKAVSKGVLFNGRNGDKSGWDNDGGYALTSEWI
jgi:hypothetical protein